MKSTYKFNKDFKNHDTTLPRKHLETESAEKQSDKSARTEYTEYKLFKSENAKEMNNKKWVGGFDNKYE